MNSKPKRVCMIALSAYPIDPRIRRQAEALVDVGYDVDILCRFSGNQLPKEKFGKITVYRLVNAPDKDSQFKYIFQSLLFMIKAFYRLQILYIKRRYNLIQVHNLPDYIIFDGIVQKLFGVKLLLDIHDPSVDFFEEKWSGKTHKFLKYLVTLSERYSCKVSNHLITVTNSCKEKLIERGNPAEKITVIFNSANENVFSFNQSRKFRKITRGVSILYYGTIAERYGLHNAIKAMEFILKDFPQSVLNIYGKYDNKYSIELQKLIHKLGLNNHVNLNSAIMRENLPDVINKHDIGLAPLFKDNYSDLALQTKVLEFISCGIPLVTTRTNEMLNIFDEKSITYINNSDSKEIAEAIRYLCFNPEIAKQQVKLACEKLREISGIVMKERYISLVNKLALNNGKLFI